MSTGRRFSLAAAALAAPFLLSAGVALAAEASGAISLTASSVPPMTSCAGVPASTSGGGLASSQIANAQIIYSVSVSLHLPQQAAVIAIATAMQESRLENIDYGTEDSLGLFQQRPSQGWGTPAQIMNPVYAATAFYDALAKVPGWQQLPLTVAAQAVQHSGYPYAYAQWQQLASTLVAQLSGAAAACLTGNGLGVPATGSTRLPAGYALAAGTPVTVRIAIAYALAQLGKPYIWGGTGPAGYDCSGLVMMAYQAAGITVPRTTFQQVDAGAPVYGLSQLQPGDLLFTAGSDGTPTDPGHVGMYIGDGLVVQAPQTGEPIMLTPLAGYWQQNTTAIRRIAGLDPPLPPLSADAKENQMNDSTGSQITIRLLSKTRPGLAETVLGPWTARARCAETDPEIFFPPKGDPATTARAICRQCPVREDCLGYALDAEEEYGIWGGLDPDERRAVRRKNKRAAAKDKGAA